MQKVEPRFLKSERGFSEIRIPRFCCIGISTMCNFRCKMCFVWNGGYVKTPNEPTLGEWYRFLGLLGDITHNSAQINFAGGEPLSDDRNLALVSFCAKKGFFTSMPTNGFLIDKEMACKIADSGLSTIGISLDGIYKDTHDFLRGIDGSYDRVMRAIDNLDRYCNDLKIEILTVISARNLDEIIRIAQRVNEDKRLCNITFQAIAQPFNTVLENEWYMENRYSFLWPHDIKMASGVMDELINLKKIGYKITNPISQLEVFKVYFENPQGFIKRTKCNVGDCYININQFGDVFLCVHKAPIGNIKKDKPEDLWYSEKTYRSRKDIEGCKKNCHHLINCCYEEEQASL